MDDIDAAFDDAFRTHRIEAGDDPSTLPNPYARPALGGPSSTTAAGSNSTDTDGGFIADDSDAGGGGFIVDDDDRGGGGFIPDDDNSAAGGGFVPEDEDEASRSQPSDITRPATIPLSAIPEALANLGLDSSDPSVLSLFAETAYAPSSSRRRLAPGVKVEKRSNASTLFTLLLDRLPPSTFPATQRRIGTTELTTILASLGETLPAKEIEEMVEEAAKLFAPASDDGTGERKSAQAVKGAAAAQGIGGASVGLDEFAGVLVHNRLL
uniref:Uncharacterized protein n=1 Tax=Kalmanozyma brasiliensis (strain GHG001) TaxID=1365824 RepID=V5E7U6_KALBG